MLVLGVLIIKCDKKKKKVEIGMINGHHKKAKVCTCHL